MGNNTSSTRKSSAAHRHGAPFRKSHQSQSNHHNLEEEFSDLILHEVKRQKQEKANDGSQPSDASTPGGPSATKYGVAGKDRFTNDLIEDEFNELNQGILENEELSRNILPTTGSDDDSDMQVDDADAAGSVVSSVEDISKVDFTKISSSASAREQAMESTPSVNSTSNHNHLHQHHHGHHGNRSRTSLNELVPVKIKWTNYAREPITKVAIIGSFSNWRDVIKLKRSSHDPNDYSTTVKLPLGVHKLLYVVNNEYRVSEQLPTATDQEGIFFNWFEVLDPRILFHNSNYSRSPGSFEHISAVQTAGEHNASQIQKKSNSFLAKVSQKEKDNLHEHVEYAEQSGHSEYRDPHDQPHDHSYTNMHQESYTSLLEDSIPLEKELVYSSEIPEMLVDYNYFKDKAPDYELPEPPQLPAHLNNVLLNKMSASQQQNQSTNIPQIGGDPAFARRPPLRRADSSYYASNEQAYHRSIPNHVILNHLMTTSIRNDVLTVACITRYSGKFVTQIMHSPADTILDS